MPEVGDRVEHAPHHAGDFGQQRAPHRDEAVSGGEELEAAGRPLPVGWFGAIGVEDLGPHSGLHSRLGGRRGGRDLGTRRGGDADRGADEFVLGSAHTVEVAVGVAGKHRVERLRDDDGRVDAEFTGAKTLGDALEAGRHRIAEQGRGAANRGSEPESCPGGLRRDSSEAFDEFDGARAALLRRESLVTE
ncbi:hypothetical protein ASE14_12260 [Agromyces sp. Root81]|nr:hypothetical protein ASE14_12260 [Agromyces sp. Root81]